MSSLKVFILSAIALVASLVSPVAAQAGILTDTAVLFPGETATYSLVFYGGSTHYVDVWGNGQGDIDCWVYSSQDVELASSEGAEDYCHLIVYRDYTEPVRLVVANRGGRVDRYHSRVVW